MADPGVSTQNFLRLLLQGAGKGADVLQQRQTMQQQQQPDLLLALQQMMQRKQIADVEQGQRERDFQFGVEGRALDVQQRAIDNKRMAEQLAMQQRAAGRQEYYNSQAVISDSLTRINQLRAESDREMQMTKLAERYPQLAPVVDMMRAGVTGASVDDIMRATGQGATRTGPDPKAVGELTAKLMQVYTEGGGANLPQGVTPKDLAAFAQRQAMAILSGQLSGGGGLDDISDDDLAAMEAQLSEQLKAMSGGRR